MSHYYQPSNRFSVGGLLLLLAGGGLTAALLAVAYVYAVWYIPFIYVNFLLTVGFGLILGMVLSGLVKAGKLRNPGLAGILALVVGLVASYLQWAVYLMLMYHTTNVESFGRRLSVAHTSFSAETLLALLAQPGTMLATMGAIAESGSWSLFGVTPSGVFLYVIWLVEALIIVGATVILARVQADRPFSELAGEWAEEETLPTPVAYLDDPAAAKATLEAGDFSVLAPRPADAPGHLFARLKLHCAPHDSECAFLSLENVKVETDDKGKTSETTTAVVEQLRVSAQRCQELRDSYRAVAVSS
ncbi:MAG: hypothetical protein H7Z21_19010 [Hymenobacter sp.]|nr:hypothetical protein [Hymenobacter sp.]